MAIDVPLFPVGLVIAGRPCLVVGGGPVAARKVAALLTCGAAVTLVAPEVHRAIRALADAGTIAAIDGPPLDVQIRPYEQGEAAGYRLVLTATGIPAVHRDDPVTVAVATGGASPALATWLRHRIAEHLGTGLGELAHLLEQARHRMHARGGSTEDVDWRALLDGPIPELVRQGRAPEALVLLEAAVDAAAPTPPGAGA